MAITKQIGPLVWEVYSPCEFKLPGKPVWLLRDAVGWALAEEGECPHFIDVPDRDTGSLWLYKVMQSMGGNHGTI